MVLPGTLPAETTPAPPPQQGSRRPLWTVLALVAAGVLLFAKANIVSALGSDSYAFLAMQGETPVTWNHCQAISYQVNPKGAPAEWREIVTAAIDDIEEASGFVFADRGETVKTRLIGGGRYAGNEWEPVLIVWSDRYQDQGLDGNVIGLGGSATIEVRGIRRYVIGQITLDSSVKDPELSKLTLEHELGHVLGLDHVDDEHQIMHPNASTQRELGRGDIAGLKRLHDVPCD